MLLALLSCQRRQTLHCLSITNTTVTDNKITIKIGDLLKQTRPGWQLADFTIKAYAPDRRLCPCRTLAEYLRRTSELRSNGTERLFISWIKPHQAVSPDTISRWLKLVMAEAGINLDLFTAHSVRSAASSAASLANVPIETIMKTAGWSQSTTFSRYYKKQIDGNVDFGRVLLDNAVHG